MLDVFLTVILPIFMVAAAGYAFQQWRRLPVSTLSQVTLYLLAPALIFDSLLEQTLPAAASFRIVAATLLVTVTIVGVSLLTSRALRHSTPMQSAFVLSTTFPNAGNMAIPILLLAFGEAGLTAAIVIFVTQSALGWSLGIYVAARSHSAGFTPLLEVLKVPVLYALAAALLAIWLDWQPPTTITRPIEMLAGAALPSMLLVLGFQLGTGLAFHQWPSLLAAMTVRLVVAAPIAYGVTILLGMSGVEQQALIVTMSMPAAVFTTILATQFDAVPRFVTNAVVASTLVSLLTLTVVITLVQNQLG